MRRFGLLLAGARGRAALSVAAVLVACAIGWGLPGIGAASSAAPGRAGSSRLARGSGLRHSQVPVRLRAAVQRTFSAGTGSLTNPSQQAELTAPYRAADPLANATTASDGGWSLAPIKNPAGPAGPLFGVSCSAASSCTAVGTRAVRSGVFVTEAQRWNGKA
ncbi:MAG: hypothetical protein ACTHQQ_22425 [Solirubrobacteraceae bacterium]